MVTERLIFLAEDEGCASWCRCSGARGAAPLQPARACPPPF